MTTTSSITQKPNVLLIYTDDVGYGDLGCYGAERIPTPNLDRMAGEGLRFTSAYATHSVCSPSRYSLLTGEYAWRKGIQILPGDAGLCIDPATYTMPRLFRDAGYRTGVVGKWHLGLGPDEGSIDWNGHITPGAREIGFDYSFLIPATGDRVPCVYLEDGRVVNLDPGDPLRVSYGEPIPNASYPVGHQNPESKTYIDSDRQHSESVINGIGRIGYMDGGRAALWDDAAMADRLVAQGKAFIDAAGDKPFFLYFATHDIHEPHVPHPRFRGESKAGVRGDAMVQLDATVGALLDHLDAKGLRDSTMVIFSSDHGPIFADGYYDDDLDFYELHKAAGPFRGGKYATMEGGMRVPFLVRWPGRVKPGVSDAVLSHVDLMASLGALLGAEVTTSPDVAPDSCNIIDALLGADPFGNPEIVQCDFHGNLAIRAGEWKYFPKGFDSAARKPSECKTEYGETLFHLRAAFPEQAMTPGEAPDMALELKRRLQSIRDRQSA